MRALASLLIGAGLGVAFALVLAPRAKQRPKQEEWDIVDEASAESFPASDSPAY